MRVIQLLTGLLPASRTKNRLLSRSERRWSVAASAHVGPVVLWRIDELTIAPGARLGLGTVFRELRKVDIGREAEIGQFNWITGVAKVMSQQEPEVAGALILAEQAAITGRHFLDCSGGVLMGAYSVIGGMRSTILSRGADPMSASQRGAPVRIGERSLIAACCVITPGVTIAPRCVVGAGSVVARDLTGEEQLYVGPTAKPVKSLHGAAFFARSSGRLMPREEFEARRRAAR